MDIILTLSTVFNIVWGVSTTIFVVWRFSSTFYSIFTIFSYFKTCLIWVVDTCRYGYNMYQDVPVDEISIHKQHTGLILYNKIYTKLFRIKAPEEYSIEKTETFVFNDSEDIHVELQIEDIEELEENEIIEDGEYSQFMYAVEEQPLTYDLNGIVLHENNNYNHYLNVMV